MGLTRCSLSNVESVVCGISENAGVAGGWIASDSEVAQRVIADIECIVGGDPGRGSGFRPTGRSFRPHPQRGARYSATNSHCPA